MYSFDCAYVLACMGFPLLKMYVYLARSFGIKFRLVIKMKLILLSQLYFDQEVG